MTEPKLIAIELSGLDFGRSKAEYWLGVLRSLQYKVSTHDRFVLLLQNASYPAAE
jgi:hypothetical protein